MFKATRIFNCTKKFQQKQIYYLRNYFLNSLEILHNVLYRERILLNVYFDHFGKRRHFRKIVDFMTSLKPSFMSKKIETSEPFTHFSLFSFNIPEWYVV